MNGLAGAGDVLVNNAGYGHEGIFEETALQDICSTSFLILYGSYLH
jgi:short-subunit dehydrogenase